MAKTYTTIPTFTAGAILTAAQMNQIGTTLNNTTVPPLARVRRSSSQNVPNATDTVLSWTDLDFDTDSMWSGAAPDRLTITTTGIYLVTATVSFIASSTGERIAYIIKNGSGATRFGQMRIGANATANETTLSVSAFVDIATSGDYIGVGVYQSAGTGTATVLGSGTSPTNLSVQFIGKKA